MVPTLFFYEFVLVALGGLFLMLYALLAVAERLRRLSPAAPAVQATPAPALARAHTVYRTHAQTPLYRLRARGLAASSASCGAPDLLLLLNQHPRHVDTSTHSYPYATCAYRG